MKLAIPLFNHFKIALEFFAFIRLQTATLIFISIGFN
jgi:hypothetical protein